MEGTPEYLAAMGRCLYGRCYDTEYVFEMVEE